MNKIFYQFTGAGDEDNYCFMYLNPIDVDLYERVDQHNPVGEASHYDLEEFNGSFETGKDKNSFMLEFIYE